MSGVFLTGGTGLIGSNIIEQLCGAGTRVRALVRPGSDASAIEALGAEVVRGDISDPKAVLAGAEGCDSAIHSAAVLGGPQQDIREHEAVNVGGAINVFEAAATLGMRRVTALNTTTFFDMTSGPLTEHSAVLENPSPDPYTLTKKQAFLEAMRRAGEGADINVVISGGAYGPAPQVNRSMEPPSFNLRVVWALRKEVDDYVGFPVPWVYTEDVARCAILALQQGRAGETYLAFGRPEDVGSMAMFMDRSCRVGGVDHHVHEVTGAELDTPEALARFGPTLIALAKQPFPVPFFQNRQTVERLGYDPIALDDGLARTITWLKEHDLASAALVTHPLSEHVGVEVRGLDLREPVDEPTADALRALLAGRHLLVFHDQDLAPADQVRALALFGEPVDEAGTGAGHTFVSNALDDGVLADGRPLVLHADNMFTPEPLHVISLYGQRIDGPTAPTWFADVDAERVLAALSESGALDAGALADLRPARVLNLSGFAGGWYRYRDAEVAPHHPRAVHPVVAVNPRSGRPALRVSEQQSDRLVDWAPERSEAVLQALFAAVSAPGNVVEHHWRTGDLVVWDNRALQHGRPPLPGPGERTLRRVAVVDDRADEQIAWTPVSLAAERTARGGAM